MLWMGKHSSKVFCSFHSRYFYTRSYLGLTGQNTLVMAHNNKVLFWKAMLQGQL